MAARTVGNSDSVGDEGGENVRDVDMGSEVVALSRTEEQEAVENTAKRMRPSASGRPKPPIDPIYE